MKLKSPLVLLVENVLDIFCGNYCGPECIGIHRQKQQQSKRSKLPAIVSSCIHNSSSRSGYI